MDGLTTTDEVEPYCFLKMLSANFSCCIRCVRNWIHVVVSMRHGGWHIPLRLRMLPRIT